MVVFLTLLIACLGLTVFSFREIVNNNFESIYFFIGIILREADLSGAKYTKNTGNFRDTEWPDGFDPVANGAISVNE